MLTALVAALVLCAPLPAPKKIIEVPWLSNAITRALNPYPDPEDQWKFGCDLSTSEVWYRSSYMIRDRLKAEKLLDSAVDLDDLIIYTTWCYECWYNLYMAQGRYISGEYWTTSYYLSELRNLIGKEAYDAGVMPYPYMPNEIFMDENVMSVMFISRGKKGK